MDIININDLNGALGKAPEAVKGDVVDFLETIINVDNINHLLPLYDDLSISDNTFSYIIKQNYQHVVFAVIGEINSDNEIELTLKSYD